jgi:hypothetical protein
LDKLRKLSLTTLFFKPRRGIIRDLTHLVFPSFSYFFFLSHTFINMDSQATTSSTTSAYKRQAPITTMNEQHQTMEMSDYPSATVDKSTEIGIGKYGGLQPSFARVTEASEDENGAYGKKNTSYFVDRIDD